MFTGIVTYVFPLKLDGKDVYIYPTDKVFNKLIKIGDSVCINGICLTVVQIENEWVRFEVTEETLNKTNLLFDANGMANIELSLLYNDNRLGGHIVWGHVHQTGHVESINLETGDLWISFCPLSKVILKYKGSIAVNGVSLTIAEVLPNENKFKICLIPHTIKVTTFHMLKRGDMVNLEFYNENINEENIKKLTDDDYMMMALEEAEISIKTTPPNPWVGCVIVKNGEIIAKGHHEKAGKDHAEVMAIKNCTCPEKLEGATLYCTLEPCCHLETACYPNQCFHKGDCPLGTRSLSCSDVIINNKISRVVVGIVDPDLRVSGNGIRKMESAGIKVDLISAETRSKVEQSLEPYIYNRKNSLPFVTLKVALTIDNCYSSTDSKWITHEGSREVLYDIWEKSGAIIIGGDTVQKDNPSLDYNDFPHKNPIGRRNEQPQRKYKKIVLDSSSLTNTNAKIFNSCDTIIFTENLEKWKDIRNCHVKKCNPKNVKEILETLNLMGIMSVLVEGGGKIHKSFFLSGLANKLLIFRGSTFFGKKGVQWEIPDCITLRYKKSTNICHENVNNSLEEYSIIFNGKKDNEIKSVEDNIKFTPIDIAVEEFKKGNMVIVMDDENRENEGDLIVAANKITEAQMTEIINNTTGIICTPLEKTRAMKLNLPQMISGNFNTDPHKTAFTISVDYKETGTGVSSLDRLKTVRALGDENSHPSDFRRPGHIFPLVAHPEGLSKRRGHTEASIALCELAGIYPRVAVIGELKNLDGTMRRRDACFTYAKNNNYPIITVQQIYEAENKVKLLAECNLKTKLGDKWRFLCFDSGKISSPHKVLIYGDVLNEKGEIKRDIDSIPIRIHSECFTGDVLGSLHCDCGEQLNESMKYIVNKGKGILIFPSDQEGRGIGILDKVKCYKMQQEDNVDTFSANVKIGHQEDARCYDDIRIILKDKLGINSSILEILTNNPHKIKSLEEFVKNRVEINIQPHPQNVKYLEDKKVYFQNTEGK